MTARHKHASGSAFAVGPIATANGTENGTDRSAPFAWEDWFRHAGAQQRALALGLAQHQGFLYAHQLPAVTNGKIPTTAAESAASTLLSRTLTGKVETLPPLAELPLCCFDAELDEVQQQAVCRALATPDVFLLQGLPGTGKSRVLAEIVRQAASRGWRVVFLAGQTASLDVVLERLVGKADVLAVRLLETSEKPETLPGWLRGFTLDEQKKAFCERVQTGARRNREQVEAACRRYGDVAPIWSELRACAERCRVLQELRQKLLSQLAEVAASVERELQLQPEVQDTGQTGGELEKTVHAQRELLAKSDQELSRLATRIADLETGYLAKKHARFWTFAFWNNLFNSGIISEMEAAQQQLIEARKSSDALSEQIAEIEKRIAESRNRVNLERAAFIAAESAVREESLRGKLQALDDNERRLGDEWAECCRCLGVESIDKTPEAIDVAHLAWLGKKARGDEECQFAHQWAKFIEESAPQWATRLASFANVLAGTVGRWHADACFRDAAYDLVLIEDADALSEADVLKLSRHGARCVLVGSAIVTAPPTPEKTARPTATKMTASAYWPRLWHALGGDAGRWPHAWTRQEGRLVCQLMPLSAEDRLHLENEGLADAPDIELGILHCPSTPPCLAQVTFGPSRAFADAFAFMVREVQEFPLQPLGRTAWWREDDRRVCHHLGPANGSVHAWLDIEPGLRLGTTADNSDDAMRIAAIEFDKAAGWDRAKADAWLACHRPIRDHERTTQLQVPYRFQQPLAKLVSSVLRCGEWLSAHPPIAAPDAPGFEFIPVPAAVKREPAGLELDLSAQRSADKLPTGLRHGLPTHGFVNYLEAQALINRLERWSQQEAGDCCRVAVLALYDGQAVLLRRLVEQSEILRARRHPLEIAVPSRLHQRECDVVFLSLTRSHPHRSTAFGEDVRELPIALTRARARLFVFGDVGALCKRLDCRGTVEHHDVHAAQQEQEHLARLLAFIHPHFHAATVANGVAKSSH
jgi:AAA domain